MPTEDEEYTKDALFRAKKKKQGYRIVSPPSPALEAPVADSHAHLDMLEDAPFALARSAVHGIGFICTIVDVFEDATTTFEMLDTWLDKASELLPDLVADASADYKIPLVRIGIGCHPHNAKDYDDDLEALLITRLRDERVSALGEVGLDYHYDFSPRSTQRDVFRRQIALAHITGLPLLLHLREAHDDALKIMDEEGFPEAGVLLHCYNLDSETLRPWLERECFVAFGGPLTFKKSEETRAAALTVPLNKLLTETDAPYMAPEPMRGMTCLPDHSIFTAERLAEVFSCEPGDARKVFLEQIYQNALGLLDREPTDWQKS